jgi:uncharacterized protein YegP (UPF0339 family)
MKFEISKNKKGQWFWRLVARNGETLCTSESYSSRAKALKTVRSVRFGALIAKQIVLIGERNE